MKKTHAQWVWKTKHRPSVPQLDYRDPSFRELVNPVVNLLSSALTSQGMLYYGQVCVNSLRKQSLKYISTITVEQAKSKFSGIRIYCDFADPELVRLKWAACRADEELVDHSVEWEAACYTFDARLYRNSYKNMMTLCPQFHDALRDHADYSGLLCETREELDELLDHMPHSKGCQQLFNYGGRELLYDICGFSKK